MGKLGEEVSQKIKSAIKAKLMELGIHIDNELPDYVMVLVANKKSQQQMEDDLSLFLGESTKIFTSWLHNVLKKLEQVTISTKAKKKEKQRKRGIDYDSNGVSSTKKIKSERPEEAVKSEPQDKLTEQEPSLESAPVPAGDNDSENDDAMSLNDHTEVRNDDVNEPESTSHDDNHEKEDDRNNKSSSNEAKPRERIKIVWDKESEAIGEESSKNRNKKTFEKVKEKDKERKTRSRSRSRNRYSSRKKLRSDEDEDRSRNKSRDPIRTKRSSPSPKRKSSGDRKVVDARDILKRKGADKKVANSKLRSRDSRSPYRRGTRSRSREPIREKQISSVLKAVIRAPEKPPPSIQSLVKVTPRPVRPPSMQPNCNLILKAVADAEKSLATSNASAKKELKASMVEENSMQDNSSIISHKAGGEALDTVIQYYKQHKILSLEDFRLLLSWKLKTKLYVRRLAPES